MYFEPEKEQTDAMDGMVFQIQKFCTDDGPGIRTTVFLKGCSLRCVWCHNPEGLSTKQDIMLDHTKCTLCGECAAICEQGCHPFEMQESGLVHLIAPQSCTRCGSCIAHCKRNALSFCGERLSVDTIMKKVLADKGFYQASGGGMTLSGGEPMLQPEFAKALLKRAKAEGLHTCVETSCGVPFDNIAPVVPYVDLFLCDIKESSSEKHKKYTGISNQLILDNIKKLDDMGKQILLRCPIIPGINDTTTHFDALIALRQQLKHVIGIQLMPYHLLAQGKSQRYGTLFEGAAFSAPSEAQVLEWNEYIKQHKKQK